MKPNGYFVTKRETRKTCGGECLIQHGAWREYWRGHGPAGTSSAESDCWFIECPNCDGNGYIESEALLTDILPEMLAGPVDAMGLVRRS
ncbi:MAG: hypothetical protein V2A79_10160 [Planctomycetota bacterium]